MAIDKHGPLVRVAETLGYSSDQIGKILAALADGAVRASDNGAPSVAEVVGLGGIVLSAAQVSTDQKKRPLLQTAMAMARRAGYHHTDPNQPIDVYELDRALAGRSVDERMRIKSSFYDLRMIPA